MPERVEYQNITIEDVDRALYSWFDKIVDAHVRSPNEDLKKVPVLFASGERWVSSRDQRGIRDKNGVLILPIISLRRTSIEQNPTMSAYGVETNNITIAKRLDGKTNIIQNAISSRELPNRNSNDAVVYEITTIPFPDFSIAMYEIVIQAQYTTQMNSILEKIFNSYDLQKSFVMPVKDSKFEQDAKDNRSFDERKILNGYYFVGFAENTSDTGNLEEFTDQERIIKYSMNIKVPVYLQLDPDGERPAIQTEKTSFKVNFRDENICFFADEEHIQEFLRNLGKKSSN